MPLNHSNLELSRKDEELEVQEAVTLGRLSVCWYKVQGLDQSGNE